MQTQVTPDVITTSEISYVIKMENANDKSIDLICICRDLKEAQTVAISFATTLEKEMSTPTTQIYRRDLENQIIISGRDLGKVYNSKLYKILTIQWCPVSHARLGVVKNEEYTPPLSSPTPPLPSPSPSLPSPSLPIQIPESTNTKQPKFKQRLTLQEKILQDTGR